jgi:dihydroxyacetone kinase-like protein
MPENIGYQQICGMLHAATAQIRQNHEMLSKLDSATGDGDHGTTILRTMEAVAKTVAEKPSADLKTLFSTTAWAVMSCDGGSTGPLLGSFFMGLGEVPADKRELTFEELVAAFAAGIGKLQRQSRAQIGDKTMMDAFLPALAALQAASSSQGIKAALTQAAVAAAAGADATRSMKAKFGRARNLGDRVLGHPDPGAVSVSLLFKGFSEGL